MFSIELVDIDEDGDLDTWLGGDESSSTGGSARVFLNPGNGDFSAVKPILLPNVPGESNSLDLLVTGTGPTRTLWINRTSGGDGTFYLSKTIQKVNWQTKTSTVAYNLRSAPNTPNAWMAWIIPVTVNGQLRIMGSKTNDNVSIPATP
jgi:hypothetical protein